MTTTEVAEEKVEEAVLEEKVADTTGHTIGWDDVLDALADLRDQARATAHTQTTQAPPSPTGGHAHG